MTIWGRSSASDSQEWGSDHGEPFGCLRLISGPIFETIVVGDDETSHLMFFPDGHDHLGEVQYLRLPGIGQ